MEIEKKWLISPKSIPYQLSSLPFHELEQFYISTHPTIRARSIDGQEHILTIKTKPKQEHTIYTRNEIEIPISRDEYENLKERRIGTTVSKRRYHHNLPSGLTEEIDLFHAPFDGLAYLEIEFPDEQSALNYTDPDWVTREVSGNSEYSNASLSQRGNAEGLF